MEVFENIKKFEKIKKNEREKKINENKMRKIIKKVPLFIKFSSTLIFLRISCEISA